MAAPTMTETLQVEPTYHMRMGAVPHPPAQAKNNNTLRLRNIRLDPTRALEPARKKLTTIESQRVMAVFDETIKRAEIVTSLPFIMQNIDRFRVSLGSELVDLIKHHSRIQNSYREIRFQLDELLQKRAKELAREESRISSAAQEEGIDFDKEGLGLDYDYDEEEEDRYIEDQNVQADEGGAGHATDVKSGSLASKPGSAHSMNESASHSEKGSARSRTESPTVAQNVEHMINEDGEQPRPSLSAHSKAGSDIEPRIEEAMRNLALVAQQVSHSCKNFLRLFTTNPTAMKILDTEAKMRDEGGQNILNSMNELRDILMHKLLTTPQEEMERMSYLDDISKRERHNAVIIEKLEHELKGAMDDKDEEIRKKNDIIKRLQTDLHQIEKFSDENIRRTRAEAEKQEIADAKNSDQKTQKLQSEINQLQTQLNNAIAEHREIEADMRAKKYKVENEVDNWIQKYDQDLGERQDEYEEIDLVYTEEKKQLFELEERFATLEKEYNEIMEERRVARDKRERAQRELALLVKSATTIQAFWRSYKVRKALKSKNKKKGGKKK